MKDFIKKNKGNIVFIVFVLVFFFVPGVRERVMRVFLFSPSVEEGNVQGVLRKEEYDIELKGINVPDSHLSDFYGKTLFLILGKLVSAMQSRVSEYSRIIHEAEGECSFRTDSNAR